MSINNKIITKNKYIVLCGQIHFDYVINETIKLGDINEIEIKRN